jgi:hypothetical protein
MKPLPMPLRLAAGLVATAIEEVHELPRKLSELPMTAVSQALQASMRIQQRITELAIKGDRALGALRPVPETPTWARFDEDEEPGLPNGAVNGLRSLDPVRPPKVTPVRILPDPEDDPDGTDAVAAPLENSDVPAPRRLAQHPTDHTAAEDEPKRRNRSKPAPKPATRPGKGGGPAGMPEYEQWTLAQLRARFRTLTLDDLHALLDWETSHQDRPPYVTMLSNRIASVSGR